MRSCETDCGYWKPEAFDGKSEWNDRKPAFSVEWQSDETVVWKSARIQILDRQPVQNDRQSAYVVGKPTIPVEWQPDETVVWKSRWIQIPRGKPVQSVWQPAYVVG